MLHAWLYSSLECNDTIAEEEELLITNHLLNARAHAHLNGHNKSSNYLSGFEVVTHEYLQYYSSGQNPELLINVPAVIFKARI